MDWNFEGAESRNRRSPGALLLELRRVATTALNLNLNPNLNPLVASRLRLRLRLRLRFELQIPFQPLLRDTISRTRTKTRTILGRPRQFQHSLNHPTTPSLKKSVGS